MPKDLNVASQAGDRLTFVSHGARIGICLGRRGLIDHVRELLPPGAVEAALPSVDTDFRLDPEPGDGGGSTFSVIQAERTIVRRATLPYALTVLGNSLHNGVAAHSPALLFVHSGAVAWNGRVIMLPGESRCGKSSLVDALVRLGATYYSDECAPVDEHGFVLPYRKPLSLREDHPRHGRSSFAERRQPPSIGEALPVGLVLFQRHRPDAVWAPEPLTPGQALLRLAAHTVLAAREPRRTLTVLSALVTRSPAYATDRPEADRIAVDVLHLLEAQISESPFRVAPPPSVRIRSA